MVSNCIVYDYKSIVYDLKGHSVWFVCALCTISTGIVYYS